VIPAKPLILLALQIIAFKTYNMFCRDAAARKRMAMSRRQA